VEEKADGGSGVEGPDGDQKVQLHGCTVRLATARSQVYSQLVLWVG